MSADQPIEVVLRTIDRLLRRPRARAVRPPRRPARPREEITGIDAGDDKITFSTRNQMNYDIVLNEGDEEMRGDLDDLIDTVRRAAPNLEESR